MPNGLAITADRKTVIYASTYRHALRAWTIEEDGTLSDPRLFAETGKALPDGICIDAEGAVWVGGLEAGFLRIRPGGEVAETISVGDKGKWATACVLGGPDGRTLFMTTAEAKRPVGPDTSRGFIETATVDVPGAGWP
jgi:sugar lactone lactonase YvrE